MTALASAVNGLVPLSPPEGSLVEDHAEDFFGAFLHELMWFALGFLALRLLTFFDVVPPMPAGLIPSISLHRDAASERKAAIKSLCAAATAGHWHWVLELWNAEKARGTLPLDALSDAAQALATVAPGRLCADLAAHLASQNGAAAQVHVVNQLVEVVVGCGRADLASELVDVMRARLGVVPDARTHE
eukprot:CAMPEP_0170263106 /NCGR_PEP_ID=MMETSP0116_2-20130129/31437_1 /TAXON_ID=400756 /ORGANISM="Durinskia baltica, Strain CSIRO CS-38" /LENGTH=187 /DNA_ID=CAMNT_0010514177 /DNA_START=61 /DNA_END=621 /DNA_ORIENTATION=+